MNWKDLLFKKKLLFHVISIALFAVITLVYCSPILEGKRIKQGDIIQFQGMSKEIQDFREKTGNEALWTNSMFGGMPAYQISVKYPNNILLHIDKALQLGFPRPIGVMFLYFLGFYILMLSMKLDYKLAFLASIAFGLSSYFLIILEAGHNTKAHAISYMAPTIAGMLWCFRGKRLLGFFLTFLFLGLQIRANHPQISYYLMFVLFSFWLAYLIYSIKDKKIKFFISNTVVFVLGCFLAIMINIASLWSTYDYSKYTMRGGSDLIQEESGLKQDYAMQWSYGKMETFNLLIPNLYGGISKSFLEDKDSEVYKKIISIQSKKEFEFEKQFNEWGKNILGVDFNLYNLLISKYQSKQITEKEMETLIELDGKIQQSEAVVIQKQNEISSELFKDIPTLQASTSQYWGPQAFTSGPVYLGATVLFFFFLSLLLFFYDTQRIKILKICLLGLCFIALLLAWGSNLEWFNNLFFNHFPLYNKFRTVSMILIIVQLAVPIIAILGLNSFLNSDINKKIKRNKIFLAAGVGVFICLGFEIFWNQFYTFSNDLPIEYASFFDTLKNEHRSLMRADVIRSITLIFLCFFSLLGFLVVGRISTKALRQALIILFILFLAPTIVTILELGDDIVDVEFFIVKRCFFSFILSLVVLLPFWLSRYIGPKNSLMLFIACLILFDLWGVNKRYLNNDDFVQKSKMDNPYNFPTNDEQIKSDTTIFRVLNTDEGFSGTNTSYFFHSLGGYHGAKLSKYQNLIDSVFLHRNPVSAFRMLNTKYFIQNKNVVKTESQFGQSPLGNAWFIENIDTVAENVDELNGLRSFFFNPATTAIINQDQLKDIKEFEYDSTATIRLIANKNNYNPSRLVYKTSDLKNTQLAVFSEIYYPKGWDVYIDGEEVNYFRVNYLLRGLMIPKGEHEIVFEFKPNSFYVGNKIALGSSIIFLITFFTVLIYYLKPELLNNIYSKSQV